MACPCRVANRADRLIEIRRGGGLRHRQRPHSRPADLPRKERRMTMPEPGSAPSWEWPPRRGRHSNRGVAHRVRSLLARTADRAGRLGRKLGGMLHGGIAAILIGICVAAALAAVTAG